MPQERCGDRNRLKPCNAGLDARQRQTEMITDETTDDTDDIERAGLSPDLDFYSNRIHAAGVDTGTDVGFSWGAPRDDGRVIVTVDQSRVEAMDQLKREVQQIHRYCRKEFGNEKPHLIELVNKFLGPRSSLYLLFYSRHLVSDYRDFAKFLGTYYMSQAMGTHQTIEELEELRWWISPTNKNMMMSKQASVP